MPYNWRHHSRWHKQEQMKYAMFRQQPLLRFQVAFKKNYKAFTFKVKEEGKQTAVRLQIKVGI